MTGDLNAIFRHRSIYTPRRFHIFMRRTTTPHSSLLTPNSKKNFHPQSRDGTPHGLTLNPEPLNLYSPNPITHSYKDDNLCLQ